MTDPLLTIDDATREFRVSPKTIRRRLSSGEIDGAYKRPGSRGPEWVMPRQSLAAAGFVPRSLAAPATLPSDAEARAAYWERRAGDAEAALRSIEAPADPGRSREWRGMGWAFVGMSLLIAFVVGLLVLSGGGDGDAEPAPPAAGAMPLVIELLERETEPGDAIGLVGERRTDVLPTGRVPAASPGSGWDSTTGPRFVVATFDEAAPPAPVRLLRASSDVLLRAPHAGMVVEVYDRGAVVAPIAPSPAPVAPGPGSAEPDTPETVVDPPAPSAAAPTSSAMASGRTQVAEGESFWSIAVDVVTAELGVDPPATVVTSYWSALIAANVDRLVEPGNPDLLHVGQMILTPPVT